MQKKPSPYAKMKSPWRKAWYFIWEDDSPLSWIVNIALAFVIIKFLVYPGLGFALHTSHPIVAVVSGSMEHDGSFDDWWLSDAQCEASRCSQRDWYVQQGIMKEEFQTYSFANGFNTGDIIILYGTNAEDLERGDVIVFMSGRADPIIHRIIREWEAGDAYHLQTKGDHNPNSIQNKLLDEYDVGEGQLIGRALFRIPLLGYIRIWASPIMGEAGN